MPLNNQLHEILSETERDFAGLLQIAGLNPARDLRGCDFTNVDFGKLEAPVIDLSRSDLTGADLSCVLGRLNLAGAIMIGTKLPEGPYRPISRSQTVIRIKFSLLKQILISAHRFYLPSRVAGRITQYLNSKSPIVTCYRSHTEQQMVAESVRNALIDYAQERVGELFARRVQNSGIRMTEIESSSTPSRIRPDTAQDLDFNFFNSLDKSRIVDKFFKSVSTLYTTSVTDHYRNAIPGKEEQLRKFGQYSNEVDRITSGRSQLSQAFATHSAQGLNIYFLNGTGIMSSILTNHIRNKVPNSRFVYLLPSKVFYGDVDYLMDKKYISNCILIRPSDLVTKQDADNFVRRFRPYEHHGLILTDETTAEIYQFVNKPVGKLKNMFISKIMEIAASRHHDGGSVTI